MTNIYSYDIVKIVRGDVEYFTPLSSPKEKHKKMKNNIDFIKLAGGELGAINFNNMIPVKKEVYTKLNITNKNLSKKDRQYYYLIKSQLLWLNKNKKYVRACAKNFYELYQNGNLATTVANRCCNFLLLAEKCKDYLKTYNYG